MEQELLKEIEDIKKRLKQLESDTEIPLEIGKAMAKRVQLENGVNPTLQLQSTKSATSENRSVNEGGASTYSVMGIPDGFHKITIDDSGIETIYYIPYFL